MERVVAQMKGKMMKWNKTGGPLDRPVTAMYLMPSTLGRGERRARTTVKRIFPSSLNPVSASSTHIL